jgi:hypothetical protein
MRRLYIEQGKVDLGRMEMQRALELAPWLSLQSYSTSTHYRNERDLDRFVGALNTAGLPE